MIRYTNIERFATHDGPGIRTCIFLKGCPLHCPWCANPETRSNHIELLQNRQKCVKCERCIKSCANKAIVFKEDRLTFDHTKCNECYKCEEACLNDAISFMGKAIDIDDLFTEVLKDKNYYDNSGGGITISGGEPFMQFYSLKEILQYAKKYHLSTAVETTGNYSKALLEETYDLIDYYLFDFKHLNPNQLKQVTGGDFDLINDNLKYLLKKDPNKINVRMPIIYGFNDSKSLIYETIDYLKRINVKKLNLLPYHSLGKVKFEQMNLEYTYPKQIMQDEDLEEFHQYALSLGMESKIGA